MRHEAEVMEYTQIDGQQVSPELGKDISVIQTWLRDSEASSAETTYRETAMEDYRFYAGDQDSDEVKAKLELANRPNSTFNEVKPKIDMLVGMAAMAKYDTVVTAKGVEDQPLVEIMNGTILHYRKKLKLNRRELDCFEHTVKSGRSLLFFYIDKANPFKPAIKAKRIPGYNYYKDPESIEYDLSDCRYLFLERWFTKDEISVFWPGFDEVFLTQGSPSSGDKPSFVNETRDKYRLVEVWYYVMTPVVYFQNPMSGEIEKASPREFNEYFKLMTGEGIEYNGEVFRVNPEELVFQESYEKVWHFAIFSGEKVFEGGRSTHMWNGIPAVEFGAYKAEDTNSWFSAVTMLKDPQRALNTMKRQLQHLIHTLPKGILIHETGAVVDIEQYEEHGSDPTFHLEVAAGKLDRIKFEKQPTISNIYQSFGMEMAQSMKDIAGIQDTMMGETASREPGITFRSKLETALAVLYILFDNFRESRFNATKILLSFIQQYVTEQEVIRITGPEGESLAEINSQLNPQVQGFNDISFGEFDVEVTETSETRTMRLVIAQIMSDFNHNNPGSIPPDIILEYADIPYTAKQRVKLFWEEQQAFQRELEMEKLEIERLKATKNNKPTKKE